MHVNPLQRLSHRNTSERKVFAMPKKDVLSKIMVIIGIFLIMAPLIVMLVLSIIRFLTDQIIQLDYLLPIELSFVSFPGALLLFWASLRMHALRIWTGVILGIMVVLFLGLFAYANLSGIASGSVEPVDWQIAVGAVIIGLYSVACLLIGIGGIILFTRLFSKKQAASFISK
jgi:hypothetical protein